MTASPALPIGASGIRWAWIAIAVIVGDQWSKAWIEGHFVLGERMALLPVLDIVRAHNPGVAFSFFADSGGWQRWAFSVLALAVSVALLVWLRRLALATHAWLVLGLALILGGAIGNAIDRVEHGYVVDFIHAHWGGAYFPAFNVADSAITVGAVLVILDALRESRRERRHALEGRREP